MSHRKRIAALTACAGLVVPLALSTTAQAADKVTDIAVGLTRVNLLNINDFHGRFDGGSIDGKLGLQVACTIETAKKTLGDDRTVFLSAGDNVGATVFASSIARDEPTIDYLNALQLKASAVGNHEFDTGFGDLTGRIDEKADWDYLGANVYERGTTKPALKEYSIQTINGVRVGVIGAVTQDTPSLVTPTGVSGLDFGDMVTAVNRVAAQLSDGNAANGEADVIVAEYHDGAASSETLASDAKFQKLVTTTSPQVDVIFNGHTHQAYLLDRATTSGTRSVSQSGSYGALVGQIQLGYDPATKTVKQYVATNLDTSKANLAECASDPQYQAAEKVVTDAIDKARVLGRVPVGKVTDDITTAYKDAKVVRGEYTTADRVKQRDDRGRESTLSNLIADAWLQQMDQPGRPGADIGIQNPGGVRAELFYPQSSDEGDGVVTMAEAAAVNPFANTLQTIDITGAQFKQLLEQQWQPEGSSRPFLKLGLSKNVRYTYDPTRAVGKRITAIYYNGKRMKSTGTYTVTGGSFLLAGGDNFTVLQQGKNIKDSGLIDTDAFVNYLKAKKQVSPRYAKGAVAVMGVPSKVSKAKLVKLTIEGVDLTSLGAPANTKFTVKVGKRSLTAARIQTVHITEPGLPTRDGRSVIRMVFVGRDLGQLMKTKSITLTAKPSGTTVTIPIVVKK